MANLTVIVGEPPYGKQRFYTAMRFTLAALSEGHGVNVFLIEDSVAAAKKGQATPEFPGVLHAQMPNCEELLAAAIRQGAKVKACGVCSKERALAQTEVIEGVEISTMKDLVRWVVEAERAVFF